MCSTYNDNKCRVVFPTGWLVGNLSYGYIDLCPKTCNLLVSLFSLACL